MESLFLRPEGLAGGGWVIAAHSQVCQVKPLLFFLSVFQFILHFLFSLCGKNISSCDRPRHILWKGFKYISVILYISWSVLQYKSSPDHSILETPPRGGNHYSILEPAGHSPFNPLNSLFLPTDTASNSQTIHSYRRSLWSKKLCLNWNLWYEVRFKRFYDGTS